MVHHQSLHSHEVLVTPRLPNFVERVIPRILEVRRPETKAPRIASHVDLHLRSPSLRYLKIPMSRSTPAQDNSSLPSPGGTPRRLRHLPYPRSPLHPLPGESSDDLRRKISAIQKFLVGDFTHLIPVHHCCYQYPFALQSFDTSQCLSHSPISHHLTSSHQFHFTVSLYSFTLQFFQLLVSNSHIFGRSEASSALLCTAAAQLLSSTLQATWRLSGNPGLPGLLGP